MMVNNSININKMNLNSFNI